jgi:hypothetical protein
LIDLNNLSNFDFFPPFLDEGAGILFFVKISNNGLAIIFIVVLSVSLKIFIDILYHGEPNNESNGIDQVWVSTITVLQLGNHFYEQQDHEVRVCHF